MMESRQSLDAKASGSMLILCLIWGLQQVAIKGVAEQIAPLWQVTLRSGIAAVAVWGVAYLRQEPLRWGHGLWRPGGLVGLLFGLEFLLVAEGLRYAPASHMAVFLYTAPIFAALGLQITLPEERLNGLQWLGIMVAFLGTAVAFLYHPAGAGSALPLTVLAGDAMGLLAGVAWASATVVIRCSALSAAPAAHTLFYQLAGGFLLLLLVACGSGQWHAELTPMVISSMLFQTVIVSFASYLAWFGLLRRYLASRLGVLSFMTPVFGVLAGGWLLHETLQPGFIAGAILILTGILIVSEHHWLLLQLRKIKG